MAAVNGAIMSQLKTGDRVVSSRALFISNNWVITNLPRFGIEFEFVDGTDLNNWERALSKPTTLVFLETPSNPTLQVIDLPAVAELAHRAGAKVIVDNVFATPIFQHPLQLGADVVVYSATKHVDGHGRCLGGAILSDDEQLVADVIAPFLRHTGPTISPFNAWVLLKGLETLQLRVREQARSALAIARFLETKREVSRVLYPGLESHPQHALAKRQMNGGFGTVVAFEINGGQTAAFRFQNSLRLVDISNNLGDSKSLITHPWTTTQQKLTEGEKFAMGVTEGLVRLSVGLEDVEDLIEDIDSALQISTKA
jgi:O-succinylhomoserine sulfhydrylase